MNTTESLEFTEEYNKAVAYITGLQETIVRQKEEIERLSKPFMCKKCGNKTDFVYLNDEGKLP